MPELSVRTPCPVCLGATLQKVGVGPGGALEVDHCPRCGGVWFEYGEVQRLRSLPPAAFWAAVGRPKQAPVPPCHDCHTPFSRAEPACPACGREPVIDCPACDRPMHGEAREGIHLDVCRHCRGVWFDHGELETVWRLQAAGAVQRRPEVAAYAAGDVLLDVLFFAPDLYVYGAYGTVQAVGAAAEAVAHLPGAVAAAPEVAVAAVEVAGEAAGGVFEVVVSIFEGIFGLLDF